MYDVRFVSQCLSDLTEVKLVFEAPCHLIFSLTSKAEDATSTIRVQTLVGFLSLPLLHSILLKKHGLKEQKTIASSSKDTTGSQMSPHTTTDEGNRPDGKETVGSHLMM